MLGSITRASAKAGYDLLVSFQQFSSDWHVDFEDSRKADGVILLGYGDYESYRGRLDQLAAQGTHFVRWGAVTDDSPPGTVGCDNRAGGRDAVRHLLAQGRRRIAFVGDASSSSSPELFDRYRGYGDALAEAGLVADPALCHGANSSEADGAAAVRALLGAGASFDGIFAATDLIAIGALHAVQDAGLNVPGDVAIVGFDDIAAASLTSPPLTTIRQDTMAAGTLLVDKLIRRIGHEDIGTKTIPGELIIRKSCGAA
jgi:DNA-binding LacI/PurR family transcriptional regulator